uniref:Dynein light chain n=1 Tax=Neobodo designis TaxID=312471 RepID=A0A7S1LAA0_NEODS|mmetsp:Transcript_17747/g.55056  ORF Transcript_17747/g.55056 Transcript_17747/m.55056 type:complete len:239 (+) Transcript_17747:126-842(+)
MQNPYRGQDSFVLRELVPTASVQAHRADREALAERVASDESAAVDVLEHLFPSFDGGEVDGTPMTSVASTSHLSKLDVIHLQEELDRRCKESNARPFGVCPVREAIYKDCLDEIIRQVTVNCAERGLLLLRVRDEARMTLAAYRTLYESSVAFGMRKALQAEQTKVDLQASIRNLEREKEELERQVQELNTKCEAIERREADRRAADEKKHAEEVSLYRKTHQTLTSQLQAIINPSKK